MSKHTPTPWKTTEVTTRPDFPFSLAIEGANGFRPGLLYADGSENKGQALANARLIAAAPELLAVVQRLFLSVNGLSATFSAVNAEYACSHLRKEIAETIREAQNAIHKATGN
jgi:hypothetical protein